MSKRRTQKKKNRTRKFILLLFLTIIMLGTSTYAWFTANQVVTINSIDVQVEASNGLQISTDASTWKSVITNADITTNAYSTNVNQLPASVTAVSTDGTVNSTSGRLNMYYGTVGTDASTGNYNITAALETDAKGTTGNYVAFDVFLRVDQTRTIYLTNESRVVASTSSEDKGLKNAARIAFVKQGTGASTATQATLIGLNNAIPASAIIWEPNIETHSTLVTSQVAPEYGVTLVNGSNTPYRGVNGPITTAVDLKSLVNGTNTTNTTAVTPDILTTSTNTQYKQAFQLTAGVTKMRIYMWIEGQDIDCENNATGSNISFNLQLSTQSAPAGG